MLVGYTLDFRLVVGGCGRRGPRLEFWVSLELHASKLKLGVTLTHGASRIEDYSRSFDIL